MLMSTALGWLTVRIDRLRPHDAAPEVVPQDSQCIQREGPHHGLGPILIRRRNWKNLAAVREAFHEHSRATEIPDSYEADRLAQAFRIEMDWRAGDGFSDAAAVVPCLDEYPPSKFGKVLTGWRVAERVQSLKAPDVVVSSWGVEEKAL